MILLIWSFQYTLNPIFHLGQFELFQCRVQRTYIIYLFIGEICSTNNISLERVWIGLSYETKIVIIYVNDMVIGLKVPDMNICEKLILLKLADKVSVHLNISSTMRKLQSCVSFRSNRRKLCSFLLTYLEYPHQNFTTKVRKI